MLLVLTLTLSLFAGCASKEEPKKEENAAAEQTTKAPEEKKEEGEEPAEEASAEIRMGYWDKGQTPYLEACVAEFNKEHPEIKVTLELNSWKEYWPKLENSIAGGGAPDVFWMNGPYFTKYAQADVILPIDEYIEKDGIDLSNYPAALLALYDLDGVQYALPKDFDTIGLWYNKKLFDEAGVDYPTDEWTWEDMVAAAKKLTKEDGSVYGIGAPYRDQTGIYSTIFANGGKIISDDKKSSGYSMPETVEAIKLWVALHEEGLTPSEASFEETKESVQFLSGRLAMIQNGSWFLNQVVEADNPADFDVVELPSVNGNKGTVIHGLGNCISAVTENPDAAWEWVKFLAGKRANEISAETAAAIPAYKGTAQAWVDARPEYNLKSFITSSENYAFPYPSSLYSGEWETAQAEILKKSYALELDVEEACKQFNDKMNEILATE